MHQSPRLTPTTFLQTLTKSWTFIDKSSWGEGLWSSEPDKVEFTDATTGLPCLIVRIPNGTLCGYVGISEEHPWFGIEYDKSVNRDKNRQNNTPEMLIVVHGDLNYSDFCQEDNKEHGVCHQALPGQPDKIWWYGFDTSHTGDLIPSRSTFAGRLNKNNIYRDIKYIKNQIASLAIQLKEIEEQCNNKQTSLTKPNS